MAMAWSARPHALLSEELMIAKRSNALRLERCSVPVSFERKPISRERALCACRRIMSDGERLNTPFDSGHFTHCFISSQSFSWYPFQSPAVAARLGHAFQKRKFRFLRPAERTRALGPSG